MTKAAVVLAVMAASVVFAVCAAGAAETASHGLVTGDSVYVRPGGAKAYRAMGKLKKGEFVDVITVSNDGKWVRIVAPEHVDAWIFAKFVDVTGARAVVTGSKVRVRARPDLKGELVNRLDKGTVLKVKGRSGDWLKIAPPRGTVAWIHAQYVRRMTGSEVAAHKLQQADLARREAEKQQAAELALKEKEAEALRKAEEERKKLEAELALKRKQAEEALRQAEDERKKRETELALKRAEEERKKAVKEQLAQLGEAMSKGTLTKFKTEVELDGWVSYIGPGLESTGATHRIVKDGRVVAVVKSGRVDLAAFVGARVRAAGRTGPLPALLIDGECINVVDVSAVQIVFN